MRGPKLTSHRWMLIGEIRKERFRALLSSGKTSGIFDDDFFKYIANRRDEFERMNLKVLALQAPIFLVLAVSLIPLHIKLNLPIFSPDDTKGLREILLLVSVGLGAFSSYLNTQVSYLNEMIQARHEKLAGDNEDVKRFLSLAFGFEFMWDPEPANVHLKKSWFKVAFKYVQVCLVALALLAVLGSMGAIQIALMVDIIRNPSISWFLSVGVVSLLIIVDAILFLSWYRRNGVFPFNSDEWRLIFERMEKRQPEMHKGLMRLAETKHRQKGLLRQLITRPKPIREALRIARKLRKRKT